MAWILERSRRGISRLSFPSGVVAVVDKGLPTSIFTAKPRDLCFSQQLRVHTSGHRFLQFGGQRQAKKPSDAFLDKFNRGVLTGAVERADLLKISASTREIDVASDPQRVLTLVEDPWPIVAKTQRVCLGRVAAGTWPTISNEDVVVEGSSLSWYCSVL